MTQHIKGPWVAERYWGGFGIHAPSPVKGQSDILIADCPEANLGAFHKGQCEGNARLIAAAPDTAAELERVKAERDELLSVAKFAAGVGRQLTDEQVKDKFQRRPAKLILMARKAIARAEGRS